MDPDLKNMPKVEIDDDGNAIVNGKIMGKASDLDKIEGVEVVNLDEPSKPDPTPKVEEKKIEVDPEDLRKFQHQTILEDTPFTKVYEVGPDIKIKVKTRSGDEQNEVSIALDDYYKKNKDAGYEAIRIMLDYNLVYAIEDINGTKIFDEKDSMEERLKIVDKMPASKKKLLWSAVEKFDKYIIAMEDSLLNFLNA